MIKACLGYGSRLSDARRAGDMHAVELETLAIEGIERAGLDPKGLAAYRSLIYAAAWLPPEQVKRSIDRLEHEGEVRRHLTGSVALWPPRSAA
jgi:hypothetical protein